MEKKNSEELRTVEKKTAKNYFFRKETLYTVFPEF